MPRIIISERHDGTMQFVGGELALANRRRFFEKNKIDEKKVVSGQLVNGTNIAWVALSNGGEKMLATDGLITNDHALWLAITVADCLPIVIYGDGVIALLHGGWRGLSGQIISLAVMKIKEKMGENIALAAWIGPGIEGHHYPVDAVVAEHFSRIVGAVSIKHNQAMLDLKTVAQEQLAESGVTQIETSKVCTFCQIEKYFSARHDKKSPNEAMVVLAKLI